MTIHPYSASIRRSPARLTRTLTLTLCASLVVPTFVRAASPIQPESIDPAATGMASPDDVQPSPFGLLQFDDSANCGTGVEVAYVGDKIIVQSGDPNGVQIAIDSWLKRNPSSATAGTPAAPPVAMAFRGGTSSATSSGSTLLDTIYYPAPEGNDTGEQIAPVHSFDLPGQDPYNVLDLARELTARLGVPAGPDYVAKPHPHEFYMPDGVPIAATALPELRKPFTLGGPEIGTSARIAVFDTGLADSSEPTLLPNVSMVTPADREEADADNDGTADNGFTGHGVSISSEISVLVPGAAVINAKTMQEGISTDFTSAQRIVQFLGSLPPGQLPNILVASFGTMACDRVPGVVGDELMPVSLRAASEWVAQMSPSQPGEMALVAAAGNHGTMRREYPAAFESVISVGALDTTLDADGDPLTSPTGTGPIADFSGRGAWVDAYAPGTGILTLHVEGPNGIDFGPWVKPGEVSEDTIIDGAAYSSGTSYATPYVASMLAEQMSLDHIGVWDAWDQLRAAGRRPQPACDGQRPGNPASVAVVLTDRGAPVDTPPGVAPAPVC